MSAYQDPSETSAATVVRLGSEFAVRLRQDLEAVLAAMVLPYGQGRTEGR